jgi:1-deoxy-D-xylulose-5-phosphate synthase
VGGIANQLSAMRTDKRYEPMLRMIKTTVSNTPIVGRPAYDLLHGLKSGIKDVLAPQGLFSDLGMKYLGPIDGHDIAALETALVQAKRFGGPVIVHAITIKGRGFKAAEDHDEDRFHSVGKIDEHTGEPLSASTAATWTDIFSDEIVRLASTNERIVAITAAMLHPTGLGAFQAAYPSRTFDVGIAEQHAVTSAAGLAMGGLHPVVALYSTFLNRAFDQLLMDVALHRLGVTLVLDRAGVTGPDGPSHHGVWDHTIAALVPGLRLADPRDATRLREALDEAVQVEDGPTMIRYSKERVPDDIPAIRTVGGVDVLAAEPDPRVLVVGYGQLVGMALDVAHRLSQQGIPATVVDPVWALPVNPALVVLASNHELVITLEDAVVGGGAGAQLSAAIAECDRPVNVRQFGLGHHFLTQGSREQVMEIAGLTAQAVARATIESLLSRDVENASSETPSTLGLPPAAEG